MDFALKVVPVCPAAALKELMMAPVPHPQNGRDLEDWTGALRLASRCTWG